MPQGQHNNLEYVPYEIKLRPTSDSTRFKFFFFLGSPSKGSNCGDLESIMIMQNHEIKTTLKHIYYSPKEEVLSFIF